MISTYEDIMLPLDLIFLRNRNQVKKKTKKTQVILCFYIHQVPISPNNKEKLRMHAMEEFGFYEIKNYS